ncbi:collagen alpha-1XXIII chain-like [Crotalus adamanteus]|uniref:Collagen alpha-1XXIII chain-like n=1 Tax=Crotalus adamanteus TaxID=8729 RepID=A0AAW1BWB9_CROAD
MLPRPPPNERSVSQGTAGTAAPCGGEPERSPPRPASPHARAREMSSPRGKAPEAAPQSGGRCAWGAVGRGPVILSLLFSLLSVGACFLLSAKTSKLQGRLVALEEELASRAWSPGEQLAAEPLLAALQPQVDDLLREKLNEGLAKLRTAREVPSECHCPPGAKVNSQYN